MTGQPKDGGGARRPCPSDHGILRDGEACGSCGGVMSPDPSGVGSSLELERPGTGAVDLDRALRAPDPIRTALQDMVREADATGGRARAALRGTP